MLGGGGFQPLQWTELPEGGMARGLASTLSRCTALVAVVDRPQVGSAVILEIGAALGRGLPVVILATNADAATGIGPVIQDLPTIVVKGDHEAAGTRLIETLHALIEAQSADPGTGLRSVPVIQSGSTFTAGVTFETKVASILEEQGARVLPERLDQTPDTGYDLAVWVDGLPHPSLNPVLIQVKRQLKTGRGNDSMAFAKKRLQATLAAHKCVLGLIVVNGSQEPDWSISSGSAIATIGAETLARINLAALLNSGRNRWVHQAG
ncbi:restriction endonuclease [Actinomadura physcomitrii]